MKVNKGYKLQIIFLFCYLWICDVTS